ncbi:hypothetical protein [Vibrio apostichopi]|uniref:hypothetical protein n=1 Tax=Vibrio apostichopi TaxID=3035453 RepID=UPI0025726D59|nr:hypothetical protein [Vibrio sp. FE10]
MKMKIICLLVISFNVNAAFKVLNITTSIDISNIYTNAIKSVEFVPSTLDLIPTDDKTKFSDTNTMLIVETDIPKEIVGIPYLISLVKNDASCIDYSGNVSQQDEFVSLTIDDKIIVEGGSLSFFDFNNNDGINKRSEHSIDLTFKPFDQIISLNKPDRCNGEIELNIEVDI